MESVLRSFWRTQALASFEDERFRGPPPVELQAQGF
jgi:hypothetical protein